MGLKELIKKWWFWLIIVIIIFLIILFLPVPLLHSPLAKLVSSPCSSHSGWAQFGRDCECLGIKIYTNTPFICEDCEKSHGCIGIVKSNWTTDKRNT